MDTLRETLGDKLSYTFREIYREFERDIQIYIK